MPASSTARLTVLGSALSLALVTLAQAPVRAQEAARTPDGHPDLQGVWDFATLTPLERPAKFEGRKFLTPAEAAELRKESTARGANDGAPLPAGQVGGYNQFWYEWGDVGDLRTSLITDPDNGRLPPLTPEAQKRAAAHRQQLREPADGPEMRDVSERCLLGYNAGPPMIGVGYNEHLQIVQTKDAVLLHTEMVHNARVVRMNGTHLPASIRPWSGDSIGHWDGDMLVVDTTNFTDRIWNQFSIWNWASDQNLHVVERFRRKDANTLEYSFTVEDPTVWTQPWTAVENMKTTTDLMYEYACHEGNYGMMGILRGARLAEKEGDVVPAQRDAR
jgi:hypothetical protein